MVFFISMYVSYLLWDYSKRYYRLLPTEYPWHAGFGSALLATVLLAFSQGVQDLNGFVLMVSLPILTFVLTLTLIVLLNVFRPRRGK